MNNDLIWLKEELESISNMKLKSSEKASLQLLAIFESYRKVGLNYEDMKKEIINNSISLFS